MEVKSIISEEDTIYLTFDDGPEPGITEFVLDELDNYGYKATFFCRGDNAAKNPELLEMLQERGHAIACHSYHHFHAYEVPSKIYLNDVEEADKVLHSLLFRPPYGSLTFRTWLALRKKYKIINWSLNSEDSEKETFNMLNAIEKMKKKTKSGDIVLFHFCHRHEKETRQILPLYLTWLHEQGYYCKIIK